MRWLARLLGLNWVTGIGLGALLAACLALAGTVWWQSGKIERLDVEAAALDRCTARIRNMIEARESDATVDPDDLSGFTVPDEWLREAD
jgi:predicted signal transduction protein with EAL and GGDEF domain